MDLQTHSVVV